MYLPFCVFGSALFQAAHEMDQCLADDGDENGCRNGFRDAGGGYSAHDQPEYSGDCHIFCLCVLLGQQKIDAAHDQQGVADGADKGGDGQCDVVLLGDLPDQFPEPACDEAEEDPAAQRDPDALCRTDFIWRSCFLLSCRFGFGLCVSI